MTYKELEKHLMEQLDHEVHEIKDKVHWHDLEEIHTITAILSCFWHPAMKTRMETT